MITINGKKYEWNDLTITSKIMILIIIVFLIFLLPLIIVCCIGAIIIALIEGSVDLLRELWKKE